MAAVVSRQSSGTKRSAGFLPPRSGTTSWPAMKKVFYAGLVAWALFELAAVWFIMPLPYSQRMRSIDLAYALHTWRWAIRTAFGLLVLFGARDALRAGGWRRWAAAAALV